jgi:hypothetical protein
VSNTLTDVPLITLGRWGLKEFLAQFAISQIVYANPGDDFPILILHSYLGSHTSSYAPNVSAIQTRQAVGKNLFRHYRRHDTRKTFHSPSRTSQKRSNQ